MNTLTRGIRNAFRNSIRTLSIVIVLGISIGLALTMLLARQAVSAKIESVKSSIGNTITISPAGARGFQGGGEPLTSDEIAKAAGIAHVTSVTSIIQDRLTTENSTLVSAVDAGSLGRRFNGGEGNAAPPAGAQGGPAGGTNRSFTPPVSLVGVSSLDGEVLTGGGKISLSSGDKIDVTSDNNEALVGKDLATKNNLSSGSTFTAYDATITVKGIYDSGNTFSNNAVVLPLKAAQRLSSQTGEVSSAIVQVDSISNIDEATTDIKSVLGSTADVVNQQESSKQALEPLENISTISLYSLIGAVIAGAIIILLTMLMIVRERRREVGVLKAIGASNIRIVGQFVVEAVTFTLLGAVLGLVIGIFGSNPVTKALVSSSSGATTTQMGIPGGGRGFARIAGIGGVALQNISATVGWQILLYGLGVAVVIAILGSAIPAWLISKVRPAEVMRAE